jgi:hypothetical protein
MHRCGGTRRTIKGSSYLASIVIFEHVIIANERRCYVSSESDQIIKAAATVLEEPNGCITQDSPRWQCVRLKLLNTLLLQRRLPGSDHPRHNRTRPEHTGCSRPHSRNGNCKLRIGPGGGYKANNVDDNGTC